MQACIDMELWNFNLGNSFPFVLKNGLIAQRQNEETKKSNNMSSSDSFDYFMEAWST